MTKSTIGDEEVENESTDDDNATWGIRGVPVSTRLRLRVKCVMLRRKPGDIINKLIIKWLENGGDLDELD